MRFLIDECLPRRLAVVLSELGYGAEHVKDVLPQVSDAVIAAYAAERGLLIVTDDRGFPEEAARAGVSLPGIIVMEQSIPSRDRAARLIAALNQHEPEGRVLIVTAERVRSSLPPHPRPMA